MRTALRHAYREQHQSGHHRAQGCEPQHWRITEPPPDRHEAAAPDGGDPEHARGPWPRERPRRDTPHARLSDQGSRAALSLRSDSDRKSVGSGKSVSVRVDLGGRRIIKKKNKENITELISNI